MSWLQLSFRRIQAFPWRTLFWLAMAVFYTLFVVGVLRMRGFFDYLASDYFAFRTSAAISLEHGFAGVYDLALQEQYQRPLFETYANGPLHGIYAPVPTPFLPPFILLFWPLLLLAPIPAFVGWTGLNAAALALYLWRLCRALGLRYGEFLFPVLLSAAAFATLFFGQVNVWLVICLGEFYLASRQGRDLPAGLWLSGILLKPHLLILLIPGLLVGRRFRLLASFAAASLALLLLSLLLAGPSGLLALARLLLGYTSGLPTNNPSVMINWRALAVNLGAFLPGPGVWWVAGLGMAVTAALGLAMGLRLGRPASPLFGLALLGIYAATCAVTWHAHVNLGLPEVVLLMGAWPYLPRPLSSAWLIVPTLIFPVAFVTVPGLAHQLVGLSLLALNLVLVAWVAWALWRQRQHEVLPGRAPLPAAADGEAGR